MLKKMLCQVLSVDEIQGKIYQVSLLLPDGETQGFHAGQYLSIDLSDKTEPSFFSIASRPGISTLTLHIQASPHNLSAIHTISTLQKRMDEKLPVRITMPFGVACIKSPPSKSLILIAAGTGFAQMKSIIDYLLDAQFTYNISLYWGVRKQDEMYMAQVVELLAQEHSHFYFKAVVAEIDNIEDTEHHNLLSDAVLSEHDTLEDNLVFVSGSPKLVFSSMDALMMAGLPKEQFYSDVLEYAADEK